MARCSNLFAGMMALLGLVSLVAGPAYAVDEKTLADAGRAEGGKVTLYSSGDPGITASLAAAFKAKYGYEVVIERLTSGALGQRFLAEANADTNHADVVMSFDKVFLQDAAKRGLLARLEGVPALAAWPKGSIWGEGLAFNIGPDIYGITWNTNLVTTKPNGWLELVDPKWKGQVLLSDPRTIGGPTRGWFWLLRKTYGDDFLRKLGQQATYSPSAVPGLQQLAAGAVALYAPSTSSAPQSMIEKGAPIQTWQPDLTLQYEALATVSVKAPHPNLARLLLNFWLTPEGQTAYNRDRFSVLPGAPQTQPVPKGAVFYDDAVVEAQLPEILNLLAIK